MRGFFITIKIVIVTYPSFFFKFTKKSMTSFYMYIYGVVELGDNEDDTLQPNYYLDIYTWSF